MRLCECLAAVGARLFLIGLAAVSAARPELQPAAVSSPLNTDCLGADLHEIAAQQSVQLLQDCVGQLQKYAEKTREQQKRSQEANRLYAGDIVAASAVLNKLQATQKAHQRVFSSFRKDQREELGQVLQDLRNRPHSVAEGRSQQELSSPALSMSEMQEDTPREGVEEPEPLTVSEGLAMASLPDEQQEEEDLAAPAPPSETQLQFERPLKLEHVAPLGTGKETQSHAGFIEAETEAAAARAMQIGAAKGPVVARGVLTEQVPDVAGDSPMKGLAPVSGDSFAVIEEGK